MAVPSFLFGGSTGETPESIKRKRDLVRAIMGASNAPKNIGEGLNALGDGIVANVLDRRANKAEEAGQATASSLFNSIIGSPSTSAPGAPASGGMPMPGAASELTAPSSSPAGPTDISGTESYIREAAAKRGIDPEIAVKVARSEGLGPGVWQSNYVKNGKRETSYGPFQLLVGGGLGDKFQKTYGKSPSDPSTVNQQIDFALDEAAQGGWSPWYGAAKVGVGSRDGLQQARALGYQPQQVASLDPSAGMTAEAATQPPPVNPPAPAPTPGYVDPRISAEGRAPMQGPTQPAPQLAPPTTVANAPQVAAQPPVAPPQPQPQQMAQNAPQQQGGQFAGVDPRLLQALQNPWLNDGQKQAVQILIQQQMQAGQQQQEEQTWRAREDYKLNSQRADPAYKLEQDYKQAQLEALKNKTGKTNLINAGEGNIYDPDTQTWIKAPNAQGQAGEGFRFGGNSVEAQALNGLIESKQLTAEQAQQLAAGKTISGPNGEMLFLTPQGIFRKDDQPSTQPQQQSGNIDLFGDGGQSADQPQAQPMQAPQNNQIIPLTAPKAASNEQLNASGFADRMHSAGQILDNNEQQGLNGVDKFLSESSIVPGIIGNSIVGKTNPTYQVYDQAKRDFINAQLRRESGAVIGPDEFRNADKQYFPQPGDSEPVIKQKREARQLAIDSMGRSAGPNYKRPAGKPEVSADIQAAREAIAKGAPRDKVIERLKAAGIDTEGL
ncbi:hypothetical protein ELI01_18700 [Rhizobium leguminosarum]|uniref:hypothetical protein n=1 Tax=Rhizobium leguminosarum TaxID=384 RepID=UPI001030E9B4|nr:hypothetical protein [Rhizobium leguminosarum]TAX57111.1 hypothetical protein ELI01_18700 [Rhizobium leguminosarum]